VVVAVAAAKRKKTKKSTDWSWRLAGIALCAFFALGVITGLSRSGHALVQRVTALLRAVPYLNRSAITPVAIPSGLTPRQPGATIALVERSDGFYALADTGELRGPVSPAAESDVAILSGPAAASAVGTQLMDYVHVLITAEAKLGVPVSEMRIREDGEAALYLERPAIAIALEISAPPDQLERAAKVLALWRDHRELIASMDLTVPGQVVVRMREGAVKSACADDPRRGRVSLTRLTRPACSTGPEVAARG
jgi:hypothetical protein